MQQTAAVEEYTGDKVHFKVHRKPACIAEFEVEVQPALVKEARKKAIKAVSKEVSMPGFRKGRAPEEMVVKKHPKEIDGQWQQEIANEVFPVVEKLSHIPRLQRDTKVSFSVKSHSMDGAKVVISYETEPVVPDVDPAQFNMPEVKRPEVTQEMIDEMIEQIRYFFAKWTTITDRPVQIGDCVRIELDAVEGNQERIFSDTRFLVKDKKMAQWMLDLVQGMQTGESKEGISVPDENATEDEKSELAPKKVRLTVLAIEEAELPPVDEDFTKKLGVPSAEDLPASIERILTKKADDHVKEVSRTQAGDFLLANYPFELPATMVQKEVQFRVNQLGRDESFVRYWNQMPDTERKKLINSIYQQSEKALRLFSLCRKILNDAQLTVSPADLPQPATSPLDMLINPQQEHLEHPQPEVRMAESYSRLILEKAEDYIIERATKVSG